jgi:hypothetical protein
VLLLRVLYVLSIGPASYIVMRTGRGKETGQAVYAPVGWLQDSTPLKKPLEWYIRLWVEE